MNTVHIYFEILILLLNQVQIVVFSDRRGCGKALTQTLARN